MYELVNAHDLGFPELERPLIITKYEQSMGRYRKVFDLRICDKNDALEILAALNSQEQNDAA